MRELRRHFRGQQVILLWDGLPSHRSRLMGEFRAKQPQAWARQPMNGRFTMSFAMSAHTSSLSKTL